MALLAQISKLSDLVLKALSSSKVGINSNSFRGYAKSKFLHQHKYVAHLYALDTADVTNAKFFNGARHFSLEKKYVHKEFDKIFGLFILV